MPCGFSNWRAAALDFHSANDGGSEERKGSRGSDDLLCDESYDLDRGGPACWAGLDEKGREQEATGEDDEAAQRVRGQLVDEAPIRAMAFDMLDRTMMCDDVEE